MENAWDFVEKYYPNYSTSDEIAYANDLSVILADEHVEGSIAWNIWLTKFDGSMTEVGVAYDQIHREIYRLSIEMYIESLKTN